MNLYKILPICSLFFIACSDENSDSIFNVESENLTSSSWIASSSSNSRNDVNSSSQTVILSSSDNSTSSSTGSSNSSSSSVTVAVSSSVNAPTSSSSTLSTISSSSERSGGDPSSSSSSRHSGPAPESSSSMDSISSSSFQNDNSSSSVPSSSAAVADPTKLFDIRVPNQEALFCVDSTAYTVFKRNVGEDDLICSFKYDGEEGFVYVQNNPTKCIGGELTPVYEVHKAEFFVNGSMQEITNVQYYGGGSHGTYSIKFTYKGKVFDYDYSTMGMGGRPCQDVDCMRVYEADGKTLVQDGCVKKERSLPIVCRRAKKDGTFASFEDTYHICESDSW